MISRSKAQNSEKGLLLRRALDLIAALNLGVAMSLKEINADEFIAILIVAEERNLLEREKTLGTAVRTK